MQYLNLLNFVILTLIIITISQIILTHVEAYFTVIPAENHVVFHTQDTQAMPTIKSDENYTIIVERNLFQVDTGYSLQESDIEPLETYMEFKDFKPANIGLTLMGTVYSTKGNSFAIIKDESAKTTSNYSLGDLVNGYRIVGIRRKKAMLQKKNEKILLVQAKGIGDTSDIGSGSSSGTRVISKSEIQRQMQNISNIYKDIAWKPYIERGKITGAVITYIRRGTFLSKLGLRKNDIIKSIDGKKIHNVQEAFKYYETLDSRNSVRLEIVRDGETINLDFNLQ